jgi:hypothetical protein
LRGSRHTDRPAEATIDWRPADLKRLTRWCDETLSPTIDGAMKFIPFRNKRTGELGVAILLGDREFREYLEEAEPVNVAEAAAAVLREIRETVRECGDEGYSTEDD